MIEAHRIICYNFFVAHRYPQQGGGVSVGIFYIFFSCRSGRCNLPLHHQMVRRWRQRQQL